MKIFFLRGFLPLVLFFVSLVSLAQDIEDLEPAADPTERIKKLEVKSLSDLQKITPYESISVLQRRYLPKTFRGELGLSISSVLSHTFFYLGGFSSRAGFFLREDHSFGVEAVGLLPPAFKTITNEIIDRPEDKAFFPYGNIFPQFYGGVYYKWSPVFGKFAVLNNKIVYFDMYISLGAGVGRVVSSYKVIERRVLARGRALASAGAVPGSELAKDIFPTGTVSIGQVFAINKNWAFAWELKGLFFYVQFESEKPYLDWNNIGLSFGLNYYFPGASYR